MNKAILIQADDWEGLYINGELVEEGHTLNQGETRIKYFINLSKVYDFNLYEMQEKFLNNEDESILYDIGNLPDKLSKLEGNYE